ncbi:MAG: hypothetical protein AAB352_00860 [Patescibacteria group bacterium]
MNKKATFILLFIVIMLGFLGFWYYRNTIFSKEILKLEILGLDSAKMGDEIKYTVKYKNNGNFVLEQPKLIFELPDNSLTEDGKTRFEKDLKDIYPGVEEIVQFNGRLLGKEGDLKVAKASLSYIPKNITARYESSTTFTTKIDAVAITLDFDLPSKIEKGKEISYSLNYFSNIDYPLENLSMKIDSVNGFNFESATPSSLDNSEWKLQTLNKAQGGRINVKGAITASANSRIIFGATLGVWQNGAFIAIKQTNADIEVIDPLLFISQQINGSSNHIASPGEKLHYKIFFRNIGSSSFDNLFMIVRLDGLAFDLSTLQSQQGQARPNDNLIVFDSKQVSELTHLNPQQENKVEFDVKLKDSWPPVPAEKNNTVIKSKVNISDISQEFDTKVNSRLEVSQKAYYSNQGNVENSGPVPPEVGKATTYTIVWQIKNYFNDVKNVKVRAVLPQGVVLTGKILPDNQIANFSMDNGSREIVWSAGDISAGAGISSSGPSLFFQVSSTPSSFQKGGTASLIGQATIFGEDQFTNSTAQSNAPAADTNLPDDQNNSGGGIVQ